MYDWDKELFVELHETVSILPPLAGLVPGLEKFLSKGKLVQPLIRRKNPLTSEWIHINMARADRPIAQMNLSMSEKECLFCPGQETRTPGCVNTGGDYLRLGNDPWNLRVFPNLYPWLIDHLNIVETKVHKISLAQLDLNEEYQALTAAAIVTKDLESRNLYPVLFRNQGWGASLSHYHWQVGGLPYIPSKVYEELSTAKKFYLRWKKTDLFTALIQSEKKGKVRFIREDKFTTVLAAYAPRSTYEIWLVSKQPVSSLSQCTAEQRHSLAENLYFVLSKLYTDLKIDTLNFVVHQIPRNKFYRLHIEILPFKHLAGAERGFGEYAIEVTPEKTASLFR